MNKCNLIISLVIIPFFVQAQEISYSINAELDSKEKIIKVNQKMKFLNNSKMEISEIFLEDWNNAYLDNNTALAKRMSDEYSRVFSFAQKKQRGYTIINKLHSSKIESWERLDDNVDLLKLSLKEKIRENESIVIEIDYEIKLPDARFTGYGFDNENINLKNWIIFFSKFQNNNWLKQSNLNLDDQSLSKSNFNIEFIANKEYNLITNLNLENVNNNLEKSSYLLVGQDLNEVEIILNIKNNFKEIITNDKKIYTDIFQLSDPLEYKLRVERIYKYLEKKFGKDFNKTLIVSESDYKKMPFYGLNQLPKFIRPFSNEFLEEITFLKSYLINYLDNKFDFNKREDHWLYRGIEIYLINDFLKEFYPNVKFLGRIAGNKFLKNYNVSKVNFNEIFINYSEYVIRLNLQQADNQPRNNLTKINSEIASPYHSGIGFDYLSELIGKSKFESILKKIPSLKKSSNLVLLFKDIEKSKYSWFFNNYINTRKSIDLRLKKTSSNTYQVFEKNNTLIPYFISFIKDDKVINENLYELYNEIKIPEIDFDYIAVNANKMLPETNQTNNWLINSKNDSKPFRIKLIGDLENPKYKSIYLRPEVTYNLYDGISPGINILNRGLKNRPFTYEIFSQYASNTENLIGSVNLKYLVNDEIGKNYSTSYNLQYKTNHYDENLRYHVFFPSISLSFRDSKDLRSNITRTFSFSNYTIKKESNDSDQYLNDYSIYNFGHFYSEIDIIKYLRTSFNTQISKNFGKMNFVFDYRKLLNNNRQFQARFYIGKFLWNKNKDNTYFNYNLSRSGDYLFNGNYLGRSEEDGILSQQFIMAGGGFKSFFDNPSTNNFILATNLNFGIWKWFESYLDLGMLKDRNEKSRYFYGTGIRLNLLPDFFELYFPVSSNNGFELSQNNYSKKIRFIISYNLESLGNLFSRRWL